MQLSDDFSTSMLGKTPDEQPQLLAHLLSRLSHTEQIRLIMTHPFFTGRCPSCKQRVQLAKASLGNCRCNACGWSDESLCQGQHSDRLTSE